jgi:hypothetical protein
MWLVGGIAMRLAATALSLLLFFIGAGMAMMRAIYYAATDTVLSGSRTQEQKQEFLVAAVTVGGPVRSLCFPGYLSAPDHENHLWATGRAVKELPGSSVGDVDMSRSSARQAAGRSPMRSALAVH